MFRVLKYLPNEERLFSLENKKLRGDMIELYNMHGVERVHKVEFFSLTKILVLKSIQWN